MYADDMSYEVAKKGTNELQNSSMRQLEESNVLFDINYMIFHLLYSTTYSNILDMTIIYCNKKLL